MISLLIIALAFSIVALLVAVCFVVGGLWDAQANAEQRRVEVECLKVDLAAAERGCNEANDARDLWQTVAFRLRDQRDEFRRQLATVSDNRCRTAAECARNLSAVQAAQRPDDSAHQCPENLCGRDYPTDTELAAHLIAQHPQPGDKAA